MTPCGGLGICVPDVVVLLDVDLVKHHILFLGVDVCLHLHGNVPWQHREQQALLDGVYEMTLVIMCVTDKYVDTFYSEGDFKRTK